MTYAGTRDPVRWGALLRRWPSLIGLLAAASQVLTGADRTTVAIIVAVAVICYLAAAALRKPWVAWVAIAGCVVVMVGGGLAGLEPLTSLAIAAAALVVIGLVTKASRTALTAEAAGALGYGGLVVVGLAIAPTVGLVLVAVTLIAHGVWDIVHLRRGAVVSPSLAEFCVALDVPLGLAVLLGLVIT